MKTWRILLYKEKDFAFYTMKGYDGEWWPMVVFKTKPRHIRYGGLDLHFSRHSHHYRIDNFLWFVEKRLFLQRIIRDQDLLDRILEKLGVQNDLRTH